jgi:hypothetical protein
MSDIDLGPRRIDYISDQGVTLTAWRAYSQAVFLTPTGAAVPYPCAIDPGAPFSVLPFSHWHQKQLKARLRASVGAPCFLTMI